MQLLLIPACYLLCALRWYVKSLYKHLFLEDTVYSNTQGSLKKWHFLICGSPNSQAPPTRPKICVCIAKALSCDGHAISVIPPLLNTITQGGGGGGEEVHVKKKNSTVSQLSALATHTPILGRIGQGAWELRLPQIRKCHFFEWPLRVWIYLLRKGAYRDFLHIIL